MEKQTIHGCSLAIRISLFYLQAHSADSFDSAASADAAACFNCS